MNFFNSLGPNPHTVRMFAAEKGIVLPLNEVDVMATEHRRPPYSVQNPMMQTPALETDVICPVARASSCLIVLAGLSGVLESVYRRPVIPHFLHSLIKSLLPGKLNRFGYRRRMGASVGP